MPVPPAHWTRKQVDEHWEVGHFLIADEIKALKAQCDPYISIIAVAQRFIVQFGQLEMYDLELILGSFHMMLTEHDELIALDDGIWIPRIKSMPENVKKKRISTRAPYYRRLCQDAWKKVAQKILKAPYWVAHHRKYSLGSAKHRSLALRFTILQRDNYRCRLCGVAARDGEHVRLEVDHITARSKGGTNDPSNLWTLCFDCNRGKRDRTL